MNTKQLARELNIIETLRVDSLANKFNNPYSVQTFKYLLVLDFEATCWEDKRKKGLRPEIIEFSVVLYKTSTGEILAQFQQYLMPTENYKLSEFCINLTGITQEKVDNGVPLGTCLMLFNQWIKKQENNYGIIIYKNKDELGNCAFVTWTDWDLGICLLKESKRKTIPVQNYLKKWVDLKALYKEFYNRNPKGLQGALNEVGIIFSGQQHSGLDDARNTAILAGRMVQDGMLLRITKEIC